MAEKLLNEYRHSVGGFKPKMTVPPTLADIQFMDIEGLLLQTTRHPETKYSKSVLDMMLSFNQAMHEAGGTICSAESLGEESVMEMILKLAHNRVRFTCLPKPPEPNNRNWNDIGKMTGLEGTKPKA